MLGAAPNKTVVLFVCLLLMYAEFLLGNILPAMEHCYHSITILKHASILPYPMFSCTASSAALLGFPSSLEYCLQLSPSFRAWPY